MDLGKPTDGSEAPNLTPNPEAEIARNNLANIKLDDGTPKWKPEQIEQFIAKKFPAQKPLPKPQDSPMALTDRANLEKTGKYNTEQIDAYIAKKQAEGKYKPIQLPSEPAEDSFIARMLGGNPELKDRTGLDKGDGMYVKPHPDVESAQTLLSKLTQIEASYGPTLNIASGTVFRNKAVADKGYADAQALRDLYVGEMAERGHDITRGEDGEVMITYLDNGVKVTEELTESLMSQIRAQDNEMKYAIAGAVAGGVVGGVLTAGAGAPAGAALGALGMTIIGAGVGNYLDTVENSLALERKINYDLAYTQAVEAGTFAFWTEAITLSTGKVAGPVFERTLATAYRKLANDNSPGGLDAVLKYLNLTKDEALLIKDKYQQFYPAPKRRTIFGREVEADENVQIMDAVVNTVEGGAEITSSFTKGTHMLRVVTERANYIRDLVSGAANSKKPIADARVALQEFSANTSKVYEEVERAAYEAIDATNFHYTANDVDLDSKLIHTFAKILYKDDDRNTFMSGMGNVLSHMEIGSMSSLFKARTELNRVLSELPPVEGRVRTMVKEKLKDVDLFINRTVLERMPAEQSAKWIADRKIAKEMITINNELKGNILYSRIFAKGVNEKKGLASAFEYVDAIDESTWKLVGLLPAEERKAVEIGMIDHIVDVFTFRGSSVGKAINFVQLQEQLDKIPFGDDTARELVARISQYSDIFTNDLNLMLRLGRMSSEQFQSYLTTDPVVRAQFAIASKLFNAGSAFSPTERANEIAAARLLRAFMVDPANPKARDDFISKTPKDIKNDMTELLKDYSVAVAENKAGRPNPGGKGIRDVRGEGNAVIFNVKQGKGVYGNGYYINEKVAGLTPTIKEQLIDTTKFANMQQIAIRLGKDKDELTVEGLKDIKALREILANDGFQGIGVDGEYMLFNSPAKPKKKAKPRKPPRKAGSNAKEDAFKSRMNNDIEYAIRDAVDGGHGSELEFIQEYKAGRLSYVHDMKRAFNNSTYILDGIRSGLSPEMIADRIKAGNNNIYDLLGREAIIKIINNTLLK